jgi:hypothetical protein
MVFEKKSVRRGGLWLAMAAGATMTGAAHAQLIAHDGYAYTPGMPLSATGMGGTGWSNLWNQAAPGDWFIDALGSSYHSGGWSLVRSGMRLRGTQAAMQRSMVLTQPLGDTAGTVWVSYVAHQSTGSSAQSWLGVKLPCVTAAGVNSFLYVGKPWGKPNWGTDAGSIASHRQTGVAATSRAFVVARIDLRPGPDDVHVWINPPLLGTPATGTANLALPGYGNFEGITKAVAELGSTGAAITGNLDELRIGRDYRSVAPLRDGVWFQGRNVIPLGDAQMDFAGDALRVSNLGSTGNDGVRIAMDSIGHDIALNVGALEPGQRFSATHLTAAGEPIAKEEFHRDAGGVTTLSADFRGVLEPDLLAVRATVYDGAGSIAQEFTMPDFTGDVVIPAVILDPPCPDGTPRRWYCAFWGGGPGSSQPFTVVWYYGCGEMGVQLADPSTLRNCVVFNLEFDNGTTGPSGTGDETLMVLQSNLEDFSILRVSGIFNDATVTGLGDVEITESCISNSECDDPLNRRLVADLGCAGESGEHGYILRSQGGTPASEIRVGLDFASTFAGAFAGEITQTIDAVMTDGQLVQVTAKMETTQDNRLKITMDASQLGDATLSVAVSDDGSHVGSYSGLAGSINVHVNNDLWFVSESSFLAWFFIDSLFEWSMYVPPGTPAPTYTISDESGSFTLIGDKLTFTLGGVDAVSSATGLSLTGRNLAGQLTLSSVAFVPKANHCPPDFNQDGFVDFFDYDGFVGAFEAGTPDADFNADGFIDFFDYDAFVGAFETGC